MKSPFGLLLWTLAPAALAVPVSAFADTVSAPISAMQPAGVVTALKAAGHSATLTQDESGDPLINADIGGWRTQVVFYDCNEVTHQACQSLQFNANFMPEKPFGAAQAIAFVKDNRFGAVSVGEDKSVNVTWDVITGNGIDPSVFAMVLKSYRLALDSIGNEVFATGKQPRLASASR